MASGWILLHRKIKDSWLWEDPAKLKWWIDIILTVNHSPSKVLIKGVLLDCERGQSVRSLESWARDWHTTKKTVSLFFKLLEKDEMVLVENLKVSTRLTVRKYSDYNELVNGKGTTQETQGKRTLPPNNKGIKNEETIISERIEREKLFIEVLRPHVERYGKDFINSFYQYWTEPNLSGSKMKMEMEKTWDLQRRLNTWERNSKKTTSFKPKPSVSGFEIDGRDLDPNIAKQIFG